MSNVENTIIKLLQSQPLGKPVRISTFEVCRLLNGIKNRNFCHKNRTSETRKDRHYGGARNPTCDCSNNVTHCCQISWRQTYQTLLKLERREVISSSRKRCIDIKRMPSTIQISRDTYRLWEIKQAPPEELPGSKIKELRE